MTKIQFGSGPNQLEGWINLQENTGDITKPLKFENDSVDYILCEHVLEHVTHQHAWIFLRECHRILKPGGVVRIIVPSIDKIWTRATDDYKTFIHQHLEQWSMAWSKYFAPFQGEATDKYWDREAVWAIIFLHGHQACWNEEMLATFVEASGLELIPSRYGVSNFTELNGVDSHWKLMGLERCKIESVVVEGQKS